MKLIDFISERLKHILCMLCGLGSPRRGIPFMYIRFNIPFESNYSYNQYPSIKLTKSETKIYRNLFRYGTFINVKHMSSVRNIYLFKEVGKMLRHFKRLVRRYCLYACGLVYKHLVKNLNHFPAKFAFVDRSIGNFLVSLIL